MRTGKIARLPDDIRNHLNRRLRDGQPARTILKWLNVLPEVRTLLAADFHNVPVSEANLSEWRRGGYRDWLVSQDALYLAANLQDQHSFGHQALADQFTAKLARWAALYYASAAQTLVAAEHRPKARWSRLHELCADIARLRRGDLHAERLAIERQWLALELSNSEQQKEKEFWAWTQRPDISAKLHPEGRGLTDEQLRQLEDDLCLMDPASPGPDVAKLMKARRLAREEAEKEDYSI